MLIQIQKEYLVIIGENTVKVTIIAKFQNFQLFFDAKTTNQKSKIDAIG